MMHGHEKSDSAIVATKPPNKAGIAAAEAVEPRVGTKGNTGQHSMRRTQIRESVSQALDRVGMPQGKGRRRSSPRSSTISASRLWKSPSTRSSGRLLRAWMA